MKDLYILPIKEAELIDEEFCRKNFPVRMERAAGYKFKEDKLRCIGAGVLLCCAAGICERDITYNQYGKPLCEGKNFSIAHSGEYVIMAISDTYVGADIELIKGRTVNIESRVCTCDELAWLDLSENPDMRTLRFYKIWTMKESIVKSEGRGLTMDMRGFSVMPMLEGRSIAISGNGEVETDGGSGGKEETVQRIYYGSNFESDGHMISVCGSDEPIRAIHLTKEML